LVTIFASEATAVRNPISTDQSSFQVVKFGRSLTGNLEDFQE